MKSQPDLHRIFTASIMNVASVLLSEPPRFVFCEMINLLIDNPPEKKNTSMQYAKNPPQIYHFKTPECSEKRHVSWDPGWHKLQIQLLLLTTFPRQFSHVVVVESTEVPSSPWKNRCHPVDGSSLHSLRTTDLPFSFWFRITAWLCETNNGLELRTMESSAFFIPWRKSNFKSL